MHVPSRVGKNGLRALAETVATVAGPILGRRKVAGSLAAAEWASIVGDRLAATCFPERVVPTPGGQGGVLHVRIASGTIGLELQHLEPVIVERINTYFGYRAIARLKLVHRPIPSKEPAAPPNAVLTAADERTIELSVAEIEDPHLRQALRGLGRRVLSRSPPATVDP